MNALDTNTSEDLMMNNTIYKAALIKFNYQETVRDGKITDWPYLSKDSIAFLVSIGIQCICLNTPSIDEEKNSNCDNHRIFFDNARNLIIEFIDASKIRAGSYIVDISVYPADTDSFPCVVKAKRIISGKLL
jgi:kynurenine formamidase